MLTHERTKHQIRAKLHAEIDTLARERDDLRAQLERLRCQLTSMAADNVRLAGEVHALRKGGAQHG
ncbi:hypothetical protein Rhal01_03821 [Rubritalea halochordaticola]|uniref:Uncharacterized protein n=1 Tax=Rubritalea halochordaticola TaxID=714537 RepID=A0ABP9V4S7_9BACT